MVLNIHSDAAYLSETRARSRVAGYYFLGAVPQNKRAIQLNGNIFVMCGIMKFVVASAVEAKLGALFMNNKEAKILRLVLGEMGHTQPPTPIHCDNKTAAGIATDTVKKHRSRSIEMRFFWVTDHVKRGSLMCSGTQVRRTLGIGDYFSKHFVGQHHVAVRPWYTLTPLSQRVLPRAQAPSALRGCDGTLDNGYLRSVPLSRVRRTLSRAPMARAA
jgi:hypothetical protein